MNKEMSLNEKAKTGREICDSIMEFYKGLGMARLEGKRYISLEEFKRRELEKWVRLEDARQEIGKLRKDFDRAINSWRTSLKEKEELKQKLQQFEEFLVAWVENDVGKKKTHYYPSQDLDLVLDFFFGLRKLLE